MKSPTKSLIQDLKPASISETITAMDFSQNINNFVPPDEAVAKNAYFRYMNQGSLHGQDVQHWLDAEGQLTADHNRSRA